MLIRVITTDRCSANLHVGNHVYNPGQDREVDLTDDEAAQLAALAAAPLAGMFAQIGTPVAVAEVAPTDPAPAPAPTKPSRGAKE